LKNELDLVKNNLNDCKKLYESTKLNLTKLEDTVAEVQRRYIEQNELIAKINDEKENDLLNLNKL